MKVKQVTIDDTPYATLEWYGVVVEMEDGTEVIANMNFSFDQEDNPTLLETVINDEVPEGFTEEELIRLIEEEYNNG